MPEKIVLEEDSDLIHQERAIAKNRKNFMEMEIEVGPIENYARNRKLAKQTVTGTDKAEMYVREKGSDYVVHGTDTPPRLQNKVDAALQHMLEEFMRRKFNTSRSSSVHKK